MRTAKSSTTALTMLMDEHVIKMLTHDILAFEMRIKKHVRVFSSPVQA